MEPHEIKPLINREVKTDEKKNSSSNKSAWQSVREWAQVIVVALIVAIPIRTFVAEPFIVDGASMDPTFATGQFLIVDRLSYRLGEPHRGDVVVFEYPNNPKIYYIKRIIGLPGESVSIKGGRVTIINKENPDGLELSEPYIANSHKSTDNFKETLTSTQYFVMGDNRAESSDSRRWGPLDEHFIVGRPFVRLWPIKTVSAFPGEHETYGDK